MNTWQAKIYNCSPKRSEEDNIQASMSFQTDICLLSAIAFTCAHIYVDMMQHYKGDKRMTAYSAVSASQEHVATKPVISPCTGLVVLSPPASAAEGVPVCLLHARLYDWLLYWHTNTARSREQSLASVPASWLLRLDQCSFVCRRTGW